MSTETLGSAGRALSPVAGCLICEEALGPERKVVFDSERLVGYVSRVYPWAVIVATQRHDCEGPWALTEAEAVDLGKMIPRITEAIRKTGSERTYILAFGEELEMPHFHVGFLARYVELSGAEHALMYARVQNENVEPLQAAADFAAAVRANL